MEVRSRPGRAPSVEPESPALRTFLIADIRGYTMFTRQRGDAAAARLARRFAEVARDVVEARGGAVPELRGDEALAVFDSPHQAVRAAVELQAACEEETAEDPTLPLGVGIGIDVGEAVPVEGGYRGSALNMAARLCAKAGAGEVLVRKAVTASVAEAPGIRLEDHEPLDLKGFDTPVEVVRVTAEDLSPLSRPKTSLEERIGAVPGDDEPIPRELDPIAPMVGREHEMHWLQGMWRQARRGRGRLVFLSGPQGIGKRRLVAELAGEVHGRSGSVRYAGAGGAGTALAIKAIRDAATASTPTVLFVNDLDVLGEEVTEALAQSVDAIASRPALVVGAFRDASGLPALTTLVERVDERGDAHRVLPPLDADGVTGIAHLYVGHDLEGLPVESMLRASGGVPGRVHEVVSDWAQNEAKRRLAAAAEWLAEGRARRKDDLRFANNVIALKLGRLYGDGEGHERPDVCPFKGLASFEVNDAAYFFGRERLVGELAARTVGAGLLGVVGPSGSGKSSLVLAGLLPSLSAGLLPGSERWRHAVMRPGEHPMEALSSVLPAGEGQPDGKGDPLTETLRGMAAGTRLVLVVDQFEEVFTTTLDAGERDAFLRSLVRAAVEDADRAVVVLTVRADFYGHIASWPRLAELLGANHALVGPMTADELRRAIELPARRVGLRVESRLAEALVAEVEGEPGGLPLLSTTLVELWRRRDGRWLRYETHEQTGGVRGAVARLAESSYRGLSDDQQQVARSVFLRLVASGEGEAAVKRRVPLAEFDLDRDPAVGEVLSRLTDDRLLTASDGTVEIAHEALIREWPRLRGWLEEDVEGRRLRGQLTQAARQWDEAGRDPSELYRGARLSASLDWAATHSEELNELERSFLSESRQASEREAERQRRTNRRLRGLLVGVATFLVLALVAGAVAAVQRGRAQEGARIATARELASAATVNLEVDPELSLLLAIEAVETTRDADGTVLREAEEVLHAALNATRVELSVPGAFGVSFSPVASRLATNRTDGTVSVWDADTGEEAVTLSGHAAKVMNLIYSFDGRRIATGSEDRTAKIWNAETGREVLTLEGHEDIVISPAFSFDRSFIATTSHDGTTRVWDTRTGKELLALGGGPGLAFSPVENLLATGGAHLEGPAGPATVWEVPSGTARLDVGEGVVDVAFSPDGAHLAYGEVTDNTARVVELADGKELAKLSGHEGAVTAVDFSPDGTRLATASEDGTARVWDVETGETELVLPGQGAAVENVDFNEDGTLLVGGSSAGTALVWDVTPAGSRELLTTVVGPPADFYRAAYSADGRRFVVTSFEGMVRVFDATTGQTVLELPHPAPVLHALFSPDGARVATGSVDGTVKVWDAVSGDEVLGIAAHPAPVASVAFSPDGSRIGSGGDDGVARVWDAGTGEPELSLSPGLGTAIDLAFSPDGSRLATTHRDDRAVLWDLSSGEELARLEHANTVFGVMFSPDGSQFATGSHDGKVKVWDAQDGAAVLTLEGHEAGVYGIAFSPDGRLLASSSADQTAKLWDLDSGEEALTLTGHDRDVTSVALSPDGGRVLTASADGTTRVYTLDVGELLTLARDRLTRGFTQPECRTYLHLERCPQPR